MSTLYIRHPSKASVEHAPPGSTLSCAYAWVADNGAVQREDNAPLSTLGGLMAQARRVVVLLAASDVTLLRMAVPPLSAARLKAALPHLVEDQLIADPADSVIVAGAQADGLRTIAVAQRSWLSTITHTLSTLGARSIALYPEQLCLPYQPGMVSAAAVLHGNVIDVALRLSEHGGLGLPVMPDRDDAADNDFADTAAAEVMQTVRVLAPGLPVTLYVPPADVGLYQRAADDSTMVIPSQWPLWIRGAQAGVLDLTPGLGAKAGPQVDWKRWRWPLVLASLFILVNIVGLNVEWLRMRREAEGLRTVMLQTFKSTYPKETVIIDPLAQMRQKMALARNESGQAAPDDFTALAASFGEAWMSVTAEQNLQGALAGIDYRERSLLVRVKPAGEALLDKIKPALAARNLALSQPSTGVWQIRTAK